MTIFQKWLQQQLNLQQCTAWKYNDLQSKKQCKVYHSHVFLIAWFLKTASVVYVSQLAQFNLPGFVCMSVTKRGHILLSKHSWFNLYVVNTVKRIYCYSKSQNSSMSYKKNQMFLVSWNGSLPLHWDNREYFSQISGEDRHCNPQPKMNYKRL